MDNGLQYVPIEKCVCDDDFNTRRRGLGDLTDLIDSIKSLGIQEPLLGKDKENDAEEVEIYAGFRRLAAAKEAELTEVPVIVSKRRDVTRKQMLLINVAENIQREELNPVDEAFALQRLQTDHSMSVEDICGKLGIKKTRVTNRFRLLKLSDSVRDAVHDSRISVTSALEIDRLPKDKQEKYVGVAEEMSGNALKKKIDKELEKLQKKLEGIEKEKKEKDPDSAAFKENIKAIKNCVSIICGGLGYTDDQTKEVKGIKYKDMDPDDAVILANFFDVLADSVEEEIPMNDTAQKEIVKYVETMGQCQNKIYNPESPSFRGVMNRGIAERAREIAVEEANEQGKSPKVTYTQARRAIDEFFTDYPDEMEEEDADE